MDEMEKIRTRVAIEKGLVHLFMAACSDDKGQRAMDLAQLLILPAVWSFFFNFYGIYSLTCL